MTNINVVNNRQPDDRGHDPHGCWALILVLFLTSNPAVMQRWEVEAERYDLRTFAHLVRLETRALIAEVHGGHGWLHTLLTLAADEVDWLNVANALRRGRS